MLFFSFKSSSITSKPIAPLSCKILEQKPWMVEICIKSMSLFAISSFDSLSLSSSAAFLVKVIINMLSGATFFSFKRYFTLSIITLVFPAPGPASILNGFSPS